MRANHLTSKLADALAGVPIIDVHTHLVGGKLGARGLHDLLLYHMLITDLYAAGCPTGARLTEFPAWPTKKEAHARIREALPYLTHIRNTSMFCALRDLLADLYDWHKPITPDNWQRLDAIIRERADDRVWHHQVLDRAAIRRAATELARRGAGEDDARLQYSLEWAMFMRSQWGEFDTALYELERSWGSPPQSPTPIGKREPTERTIRSMDDVHAAVAHYVNVMPEDDIFSTAVSFSSDIDYRPVTDDQMRTAMANRRGAGAPERDIYASYINEAFLTALEDKADKITFQFSVGAEPLPYETGSRVAQRTVAQAAAMIARHPSIRFQCFLASRHANQSFCTLVRELPNFSLAGYWWHNFFPDTIRQIMAERLDMLPLNKQVGFFSDAYCVEWAYAKTRLVRAILADVLAANIERGRYTFDDALSIARAVLFESPQTLLHMTPAEPSQCAGG